MKIYLIEEEVLGVEIEEEAKCELCGGTGIIAYEEDPATGIYQKEKACICQF